MLTLPSLSQAECPILLEVLEGQKEHRVAGIDTRRRSAASGDAEPPASATAVTIAAVAAGTAQRRGAGPWTRSP